MGAVWIDLLDPSEAELREKAPRELEESAMQVLPRLRGGFSFVMMDERTIFAARDPHGLRPLSIGKLPGGFCFASETAALDIVGPALE